MASSAFDCYLCGTANPPDADYCVRCSGQLLKVPELDDPLDDGMSDSALPMSFENPFETEEPDIPIEAEPKKPTRKVHASIEDQRLSDALGLSEVAEEPPPKASKPAAQAPSPAKAKSSPVRGDDAMDTGHLPQPNVNRKQGVFSSRGDEEVGRVAWVIVGVLFLAVGWLGYSTLFSSTERPSPESIGFVAETTTMPPTTTIPETEELISLAEAESKYDASLVRIVPFACQAGVGEQSGEPVVGVAINAHSVMVGPGLPAGTNAVRVVTRSGSTRVAILSQLDGATIATSNLRTNRNLEIEDLGNEASFFISYDLESNDVVASETSEGASVEIEVSETGAIYQVRAGGNSVGVEQLAALDLNIEIDEERSIVGSSTCAETADFVLSEPATADNAPEETDPEETE